MRALIARFRCKLQLLTPERVAQLDQARLKHRIMLDPDDADDEGEAQKYGTIGAVARDLNSNLAAATSTGGIVNKRMGRVGDSPIVGAGVYADNETCAVSATGYGEDFMRTVIAKTISDALYFKGGDAQSAVAEGIAYLRRKVTGRGGVIVIDKDGKCASGFTITSALRAGAGKMPAVPKEDIGNKVRHGNEGSERRADYAMIPTVPFTGLPSHISMKTLFQ